LEHPSSNGPVIEGPTVEARRGIAVACGSAEATVADPPEDRGIRPTPRGRSSSEDPNALLADVERMASELEGLNPRDQPNERWSVSDIDLRSLLEILDPGARETLRRVLIHDQGEQPPRPTDRC
jgi:hypothetical protein